MTEHTPGPWRLSDTAMIPHSEVTSDSGHIALIAVGREGHEANARLIAAAPELLTGAEELIEWTDKWAKQHVISLQMITALNALRIAIKKARGQS